MKIGIIGAGAIGQKHAEAVRNAGAEVSWIVDVDQKLGGEMAELYGARYSGTPEPLWHDDTTPSVVVSVPNWLHKSFALAALNAQKDLLLEKPMALNAGQCREIADCAEAHGRVLQIGYAHRYTGVGIQAKTLIDKGLVGDIYHVRANLFLRRGIPGLGKWFTTRECSGGGSLIDVGVHLVDLSLFLMGFPKPSQVFGQTYKNFGRRMKEYDFENMWAGPPNYDGICDVEDAAEALIKFSNGATLELHVAWAGNYPSKLMPVSQVAVLGERAGIAFELFGTEVHLTHSDQGKLEDVSIPTEADDFMLLQMQDFLRGVAKRDVLGATPRQAIVVQSIVDAIYQSSHSSETVVMS